MKILNVNTKNINFGQRKMNKNQKIEEILRDFENSYSLTDTVRMLNARQDLTKESPFAYSMGDHKLILGATYNIDDSIKNLQTVGSLGLACAPIFVADTRSGNNGQYALVILQYPQLSKLEGGLEKNIDYVSYLDRAHFVNELLRLNTQTNLYNNSILENPEEICITKEGGIFVPNWIELKSFDSEKEKGTWFNKLRSLLKMEKH